MVEEMNADRALTILTIEDQRGGLMNGADGDGLV